MNAAANKIPRMPNITIATTANVISMNFFSFPVHPKCLNFNENIGNSDTKSKDVTITITIIATGLQQKSVNQSDTPSFNRVSDVATNEERNNALAGVGKPIKLLVCLSSILNFANLNAENAGIKNAM